MKRHLIAGALTAAGLLAAPLAASAQDNSWLLDLQNPSCSAESKQAVADGVRKQIEDSVARAVAAIQPPAAIGDLSCLNDLMTAPLDMFSNVGGILGSLQGGLDGAISGAGGGVSRQVCQFAAEKWGEVSGPLNERLGTLSGVGSNLWSNFDLAGNGSRPSNNTSGSGSWSPGGGVPNPVDPYDHEEVTDIGTDDDPPPMIDGCTSAMQTLGLCLPKPENPYYGGGNH